MQKALNPGAHQHLKKPKTILPIDMCACSMQPQLHEFGNHFQSDAHPKDTAAFSRATASAAAAWKALRVPWLRGVRCC